MTINFIESENQWESFILKFPEANFLQSWYWGEFHRSLGKDVVRLVIESDNEVLILAQIVVEKARRGTYLTIAGGPLFKLEDSKYFARFVTEIKKLAVQKKASFIRVRPQLYKSDEVEKVFSANGFVSSPMHLTADLTIQLDLNLGAEQLLKEMRKNTRYEIRRSQKLGIKTKISTDSNLLKSFYQHQLVLAEKHKFVPFSEEFLSKQFVEFKKHDLVELISSYDENDNLLASAFIIFYNDEAVYHYGISTLDNQKLPGSYACQWRAIERAIERGCNRYNLWGVAPLDQPDHRFAGVSIFKRGFGGKEVEYLAAHDLATSPKYYLTKFFEDLRRRYRRL